MASFKSRLPADYVDATYRSRFAHYASVPASAAGGAIGGAAAGVAGAAVGPIALAVSASGGGRKTANRLVKGYQNKFADTVLKPAAELAKTDPAGAQAMVADAWPKFLTSIDQFAKGPYQNGTLAGDNAKVVQQMLSTPSFMNTVKSLLGKDPLSSDYTGSFMSSAQPGGTGLGGGSSLSGVGGAVLSGLGAILPEILGGGTQPKGTPPYTPQPGTTAGSGSGASGDWSVDPESGEVVYTGKGAGAGQQSTSKFTQYLPSIISGGLTLAGGLLGSSAAKDAAQTQANAANQATQLQRDIFNQQQQNALPWLQSGQGAVLRLSDMLNPGGALDQQWDQQFVAPTGVTEQNDPGFQARLQMGQQALERSAAAKGGVLSGGTLKGINRYAQDYASNEYGNVYNRAKDEYNTAYNQFQQGQSNRFNRLASLAGLGQTAAGQLGQAGQAFGAQAGGNITGAGAALAAGQVGSANAVGGALGNIGNNLLGALTLQQLNRSSYQPLNSGS
jgi:hypothetical protein